MVWKAFPASNYSNRQEKKVRETNKSETLSIQPKIPEIPEIFRNKIPEFWVYLARLSLRSRKSEQPENSEITLPFEKIAVSSTSLP